MEDRQRPKPTGTNRPTQTHTPTPTPHTKGTKGGDGTTRGTPPPPHQGGTRHRARTRVHYADHHQPTPTPEQTAAGGRRTTTTHNTTEQHPHAHHTTPPHVSVVIAGRQRPDPSRTRKLRPPAPMVLRPPGRGRAGHHRAHTTPPTTHTKRRPAGENKQQPDVLSRSSDRAYVRLHGPPLLREYPIRPQSSRAGARSRSAHAAIGSRASPRKAHAGLGSWLLSCEVVNGEGGLGSRVGSS